MTIHPHQALNGHIRPFAPQRNALSAAFTLLKQDIQSASKALQAAEQRAQDFQDILDLLEDEESEEDPEKPHSLACETVQEIISSPAEEIISSPAEEIISSPAEEIISSPAEEKWGPPHRSSSTRKSFIYEMIGDRSAFIHGWFGKSAQAAMRKLTQSSSKADARMMLEQIASSVESGDIRWAGQTFDSTFVNLRWLFPYLPPKFASNLDPTSIGRGLTPNMDLFRQLNDLCRERTRKNHETRLKNGYPAFHRSEKDNEELEQLARQRWKEEMLQRASVTAAKAPPEKAAGTPPSPALSPQDARAIALDPSQWTMDTMPIIYHGVTLWPPEPDAINPISRTDAEIAYWLAHEYLIEVRRLRGKNPLVDGMDLRQKFKYLKKIPANNGVIRGLHRIAHIVHNDIGTDADNRIPLFEVNMV